MAMASSSLGFLSIPSINIHGSRRSSVRSPLFFTVKVNAKAIDVENNELSVSTANAKPWEVLFEKKDAKAGGSYPGRKMGVCTGRDPTKKSAEWLRQRAPEYLALNESVLKLVKRFSDSNKPIASICRGQLILAGAGILKEKTCTAYPAVKLDVLLSGGEWLEPEPITTCFRDGNLVTAAAWPAHPQFISQIMASLGIKVSF